MTKYHGNFIDSVKVYLKSGDGGDGIVHFRREKYVPKGGPDGGDGGRGGNIIIRGNAKLWTLLHLRYKRHIKAENGKPGGAARRTGAAGKDVIIDVPLGTIVKDAETQKIITEIVKDGEEKILLRGGKGGLGNWHFKSPTNRTPRNAKPGEKGKEGWFIFELKILADVGLVGFPNAGKSTLLATLTAAKPKIADYPFTTLKPNIGIVKYYDYNSFVMADIPGIIEGAAEGKGLGIQFLRHIERNSLLLFMIPANSKNITKEYKILLSELNKYNPQLLDKQRVIAISKADLLTETEKNQLAKKLNLDAPFLFISSFTKENLNKLKDILWQKLNP